MKKFIDKAWFFPVTFLVLHAITHLIWFWLLNQQRPHEILETLEHFFIQWIFWLPGTKFPNFLGWFLILWFFIKKPYRKVLYGYMFFLWLEQYFMSAIISVHEDEVRSFYYFFYYADIDYLNLGVGAYLCFSPIWAVLHLVFLLIIRIKRRNSNGKIEI